jgi:outer membrane protein W
MLKKTSLFMAFLIGNASVVSAQILSVGPVVGGNFSTVSEALNTKYLLGPSFGAFANYSVNDHFGLGLKVIYTQVGTAYENTVAERRLHYIQVPVTAVYYFGEVGNAFRPKIYLGAYAAPLIQATDENGDVLLGADGKSTYAAFDYGGVGGIGFNYRVQSRTWLNVEAGMTRGIADVTKNDLAYQNSVFTLQVGLSFPVGK